MNPQLTCSQRQWLHSSVGRASHRWSRGHGFKPRWSPDFFSGLFTQLHKLRSLRRSLLHFHNHVLLVWMGLLSWAPHPDWPIWSLFVCESGLVLCWITLWDCLGMLLLPLLAIISGLRRKQGQNSSARTAGPQTQFHKYNSDPVSPIKRPLQTLHCKPSCRRRHFSGPREVCLLLVRHRLSYVALLRYWLTIAVCCFDKSFKSVFVRWMAKALMSRTEIPS